MILYSIDTLILVQFQVVFYPICVEIFHFLSSKMVSLLLRQG